MSKVKEQYEEKAAQAMEILRDLLGPTAYDAMCKYLELDLNDEEPAIYMGKERFKCARQGITELVIMMQANSCN
jgi:hypothetical protein